jgi:hypothetical protein
VGRRTAIGGAIALALIVLGAWMLRIPRGAGAGALNLDVDLYFYPLYEATYRRIAAGVLPTWNPYQLCGIPWIATLQAGVFYPLHLLLASSYVEAIDVIDSAPEAPERGAPSHVVVDDEQVVEVEATLSHPGLVVLADAHYPGWRATTDGVPARIVATNHLFRGVPAPAGTHRIRFEYRPRSVVAGTRISIVGWLVIVGLAFAARRRPTAPAR